MNPYALIDLHCDTLTDCIHKGLTPDTLDDPGRVLSLSSLPSDVHWAQFYAIFIPDQHRGQAAIDYYETNRDNFNRQMEKFHDRISPCRSASDMHAAWEAGKTAAFLTIEGGAALAGDITRVKKLADDGVRCMTLTWNGENELGSGHTTTHGMTDFGRQAVREMEDRGILVDVSHLNDTGYADLFETARRPFVATHSNARAICSHKRNLTDDMIREMVGSDGTVREKDKEAIQFVKNKIDSAKWFISAIKQRHDTLMRTMQTILDYQQEYFKDGDKSKLRPMILKDIADRTGLDVSTISRVVNSKYVQTQFGIILLKSLFSEAMQTESGEEVSSYEIKNILQECIDEEDKRHPLTDETLMDILNSKGYRIARRTVAKYREMLGIPVARLRKQI